MKQLLSTFIFLAVVVTAALYAQQKSTHIQPAPQASAKMLPEMYEEVPVLLLEANADVVRRLRSEFTPMPAKTPELEIAERACDELAKKDKNLPWYAPTRYQALAGSSSDCAKIAEYYKRRDAVGEIAGVFIAARQRRNSKELELIGTVAIPFEFSFSEDVYKKLITTEPVTQGTLSVEALKRLPTKVVTTKLPTNDAIGMVYVKEPIENTSYETMYDYCAALLRRADIFNRPRFLRGVVLRSMNGTIAGVTGVEFVQQPEIRTNVLLYEATAEAMVRFREQCTPEVEKDSIILQAERECAMTDSIITKTEQKRAIPKAWVQSLPCEIVKKFYVKKTDTQRIGRVYVITADVAKGAAPEILGVISTTWGDLEESLSRKGQVYAIFQNPISAGTLNADDLAEFPTKTPDGSKGSIAGTPHSTMYAYFVEMLRTKRYGSVFKAASVNYITGAITLRNLLDIEPLSAK